MQVACPKCGRIAQYRGQEIVPHFAGYEASRPTKMWIRVTGLPDKSGLGFYALVLADDPVSSFMNLYTSGFFVRNIPQTRN
jgi:hypothetical protein